MHTPLLIYSALALSTEFKRILDKKPNTPILSSEFVKSWVVKGSAPAVQDYGRCIKADTEIYVGIYIIALIFIGGSNMLNVFMFW